MRDAEGPESTQTGRVLLVAALLLAVGATALLILADDVKWLRLGIVAALWAALVGAFVAAKFRRQVADREDEMADRQAVYELELEREVAARREFELEVEAEARRKSERGSHDDMAALRQEVSALRQSLEVLLGGEVLVERVALHAESTRMRSLTDSSQPLTDSRPLTVRQSGIRRITAAQSERETELIERVHVARQPARQAPKRPEPRRPEPSRSSYVNEGSERWFAGAQAVGRPDDLPKTIDAERPQARDAQARPGARVPGRRTAEAEPPSRRVEPVAEPTPNRGAVAEQAPGRRAAAETGGYRGVAEQPPSRGAVAEQAPGRRAAAETGGYPTVAEQPPSRRAATETSHRPIGERTTPASTPVQAPNRGAQSSGYRPDPSAYQPKPPPAPSSIANRLEETGSNYVAPAQPSRHANPAEQTGVRPANNDTYRAAAEQFVTERSGYTSALEQSTNYAEPSGHHAVPDAAAGGGRRRAAEEPPAGSHASGTSVSELLAAHGQGASPRRRRRRDDDD
ncbi:DUF6779 domain-containing protein [Labedaea rhizosphaerae]|uniref:DUF6779 domain-containing protein n=1 Tax=Labedaea rhizosphaerae TaxID=598644 RepID=A0A4R6SL83_LABRH|nr:DUF6779 domain-containing protein [Labedaea rhizosphaerae]TDQ04707.1 hypothetical protein EV186_101662 [Labedaea rhizosphaerae]